MSECLRGLASEDVHSQHAKLPRDVLLRGSREAVETRRDADACELELFEKANELCLRQSADDSTGPQVDVVPYAFRELALHYDISEKQPTAGLEYASDLSESLGLVSGQVEHTI